MGLPWGFCNRLDSAAEVKTVETTKYTKKHEIKSQRRLLGMGYGSGFAFSRLEFVETEVML
jgi:hypothetical protein